MELELIRSDRKTIAIEIRPDGRVIVRAPRRMKKEEIEAFVREKSQWIQEHLAMAQQRQREMEPPLTMDEINKLADLALVDIPKRVEKFAPLVGVTVGKITIRNQKTRWGSCSGKGNLNFNCLLMLCPEAVRDYVVVHELCHRLELNHSARFWAHVERILPDYRLRRKWLKDNGGALIGRLRG